MRGCYCNIKNLSTTIYIQPSPLEIFSIMSFHNQTATVQGFLSYITNYREFISKMDIGFFSNNIKLFPITDIIRNVSEKDQTDRDIFRLIPNSIKTLPWQKSPPGFPLKSDIYNDNHSFLLFLFFRNIFCNA